MIPPAAPPPGASDQHTSRRNFLKLAGLSLWLGAMAPHRSLLDRLLAMGFEIREGVLFAATVAAASPATSQTLETMGQSHTDITGLLVGW